MTFVAKQSLFEMFAVKSPVPEPLGYRIVVRPKPAGDKRGSLFLAQRTKNAEMAVRTIGQIVAIGAQAWKAKTEALNFQDDPVASSMKVGDWVVYQHHSGQKLRLRPESGRPVLLDDDEAPDSFLLLMSDTDILARLTEEQTEQFTDWL